MNPLISIVIPTYNEEEYLETCLKAVFKQDYPTNKLEVIIVDNYSTDKTIEIAKKYKVKILMNKLKDAQASKMVALKKMKGDFFIYLDADLEILGKDWINKLLKPLIENKKIVASFTKFVPMKKDAAICRYLSYDTLQRDPIYEFFSPSIETTISEWKDGYAICNYTLDKIPPSGLCLFRSSAILDVWNIGKDLKYMELDSLVRLVKKGYTEFAYVPSAGMHHPFVESLGDLLKKRSRNIKKNYLKQNSPRLYRWFNLNSFSGFLKVLIWVLYASTIILPTARGIYKCIKYRTFDCLYEPIVVFTETWIIIYGFIKYTVLPYKIEYV